MQHRRPWWKKWLYRTSPQTLRGRFFLILIIPIIIAQGVTGFIFLDHHWSTVRYRLASTLAQEIVMLVNANHRSDAQQLAADLGIRMMHTERHDKERGFLAWAQSLFGRDQPLTQLLKERLPYPVEVRSDHNIVTVTVFLPNDQLVLQTSQKKIFSNTIFAYVLWSVALSILLVVIAWSFMRNQMRPIRDLALAAESFGREKVRRPLKPSGALEIRSATRAFNAMQDNILRSEKQRTVMLAGISHDLRTPLTRIRLAVAMLDAQHDMMRDITDMQELIDSYLAFVRDDYADPWQTINIQAFLRSLILPEGVEMRSASVNVRAKPLLLKRAVINLVHNAVEYGQGHIRVVTENQEHTIMLWIENAGDTLSPGDFERAKTPFSRLDTARAGPHAGLGLSIAEEIAIIHGQGLVLDSAYEGGVRIGMVLSYAH